MVSVLHLTTEETNLGDEKVTPPSSTFHCTRTLGVLSFPLNSEEVDGTLGVPVDSG